MIRIKELRKANGLTQAQLAEMAGISRSHLAEVEGGTRPINSIRLKKIAACFGLMEADLFEPNPTRLWDLPNSTLLRVRPGRMDSRHSSRLLA